MAIGSPEKVEAYLAGLPAPQRRALERLRNQIRAAAPKAEEGFGYGLPGFYQDGPVFYYGAGNSHLALYGTRPPGFEDELEPYPTSKGTLRFTLEHPLPPALVKRLVQAQVRRNQDAARTKGASPKAAARSQPKPRRAGKRAVKKAL